jgi:hypothetical protein
MQGTSHHQTSELWRRTRENQYNESSYTQQEEFDPSDFDEVLQ